MRSSTFRVEPQNSWPPFGVVLLASLASGCGLEAEDTGQGRLSFTVWGEEFIEQGIPASAFEDGWSVVFDEFSLAVGDISVNDSSGAAGGAIAGRRPFNLLEPGPQPVGSFTLEARAWNQVGYSVSDLTVSGSASRDGQTKEFSWEFTGTTRYADCVSDADGRRVHGIVVANGGDEVVELTIHGDHFFYDDLASAQAVPRFDAIASADRNADGNVTLEELEAVKLVAIPQGTYGTGSASHVDDLGAFVRALSVTLGHFRGEGHCLASRE